MELYNKNYMYILFIRFFILIYKIMCLDNIYFFNLVLFSNAYMVYYNKIENERYHLIEIWNENHMCFYF